MIVPIDPKNSKLKKKAEQLKKEIQEFASVEIDYSDKRPGEKFNHWEMKGVPIRIDLGLKDLEKKKITIFRRDLDLKEEVDEKTAIKEIIKISEEFTKNLIKKADKDFKGRIKEAKNLKEIKSAIEEGSIAKCNLCSMEKEGTPCAKIIEKETEAEVRGTRLDQKEKASGKCSICGKKANHMTYIARAY